MEERTLNEKRKQKDAEVAEVRYAVRENAATAMNVIARRLRLSFLTFQAAREALPVADHIADAVVASDVIVYSLIVLTPTAVLVHRWRFSNPGKRPDISRNRHIV